MFKVNFLANQMVEDVDINAIGYNLANTAYTSFSNETTYGVDALNEITQQVVTAGVKRGAGENCAVSLQDNTVFIHSGTAFFSSGATMVVDDEGISLELEDSTQTNYVYLFLDTALNVAGARCTTSMPSTLDCILLAEVSGSGDVTQNIERFCKNKIHDAPNTPLVIYNSISGDGTQTESLVEEISVPNLEKYSLARIVFDKSIVPSNWNTGFQTGWTYQGADSGIVIALYDLQKFYYGDYNFNESNNEYKALGYFNDGIYTGITIPAYWIRNADSFRPYAYIPIIFTIFNSDHHDARLGYVGFNFDENKVTIKFPNKRGGSQGIGYETKVEPSTVRVELFAGEVE